jgi:Calcineurin-like phosphoesterase superfamily domain
MTATVQRTSRPGAGVLSARPGRGRALRLGVAAAVVSWLVACSAGGMVVALRAFSAADYRLGPARVRIQSSFAPVGTADVYIPLVDWGVRAHPFTAPIRLDATVLSLDRAATLETIQTPTSATGRVARAEADAPGVVRAALARAALVALIGGVAGGAVGGLALVMLTRRRRGVVAGLAVGAACAAAAVTVSGALLRSPDYAVFRTPTFYAHGGDLPRLVALEDQIQAAGSDYTSSYQQALAGMDTLLGAAAGMPAPAGDRTFLVGSDIHSNWLTLPAFTAFADHRPVFLVGDFTQQGTPVEAAIAGRAARLGHPTVVVSGNHDTPLVMRRLAANGAIVVTHAGRMGASGRVHGPAVQRIAGMLVAGYESPLEASAGSYGHRLDYTPAELAAQTGAVEAWLDALTPRPQIVLVHDFRIAAALRAHAAAGSAAPLLILTGHDHKQHVDQTGSVVEVDGGTLGAGGVFDVGRMPAGFAQVHLTAAGWPEAVDVIAADPITGEATAHRVALTEPQSVSSRS